MRRIIFILISLVVAAQAWSVPFYPVQRAPMRFTRFAPPPPHRIPITPDGKDDEGEDEARWFSNSLNKHANNVTVPVHEPDEYQRPKRGHDDYNYDHDHDHSHGTRGVTGPVHTFVKTDKNANYKWGVRHHVGNKYAS